MQNTFHAVMAIREMTNIHDIDFNMNGHFELIFDGKTAVNFYQIDNQTIEFCTILAEATQTLVPARFEKLLHANYLGHGTGGGRIALDPRDRTLLICERLDVAGLDARMLQSRIERFVSYARMWQGGEMIEYLEDNHVESVPAGDEMAMQIRG